MKKYFFILIILNLSGFIHIVYSQNNTSPLKGLEFILGDWTTGDDGIKIFENWKRESDTTFVGTPFINPKGDTIINGKYIIAAAKEKIFYNNESVNGDKYAVYQLTSLKDNHAVFETNDRNYAPKIEYKFIHNTLTKTSTGSFHNEGGVICEINFKKVK
jgi:hypothetical protein